MRGIRSPRDPGLPLLMRELLAPAAAPGDRDAGTGEADWGSFSFVQLGGDSLLAMRAVGEADARLGIRLRVADLLSERPLSQVIANAATDTAAVHMRPSQPALIQPSPNAAGSAPSSAQQGMWLRQRLFGSSPYNLVFICWIDGPLRTDLLEAALAATIARHDGLRTIFVATGRSIERQVTDWRLTLDQRRSIPGTTFDESVTRAATDIGRMPFDLGGAPPMRVTLMRGGHRRHALIMAVHHILLDGVAVGLVLKEVFGRYAAAESGVLPEDGPTVGPAEYDTWIERLRASGELDRQSAFWKRQLEDAPTILTLPTDRVRPAFPDLDGQRVPVDLGQGLSARVRERARHLGITPAALLLAAYGLTLSRYTSSRTILIGTPVAGRPTAALAALAAVTVNLVPVRIEVDDDQTAATYLRRTQHSLAQSLENSAVPFAEIVAQSGPATASDRHPLVQVAFGMHDGLIPARLSTPTLEVTIAEGHGGGAQFDLELFISRSEPSFAGSLEYATTIWQSTDAEAFGADFAAAVDELSAQVPVPMESIRCIAPQRRARLEQVALSVGMYPRTSIDDLFRHQVSRAPDRIAVSDGQRMLTYAQVAHAASVQARLLAEAGVRPGDTVLVGLDRSIAEIVAVVGVLWAGAAYCGLEPETPAARLAQLVSILRPAAVLGGKTMTDTFRGPRELACWDESWAMRSGAVPTGATDPERLAYIAFTSGSTGRPKGVCIPHRGVLRLVSGLTDYSPVGQADRMLRFAPLAFDASTFEIWGALLTGASLAICPPGIPSPQDLGCFIREKGVSVAWLTSGLFNLMAEFASHELAGLRYLLTGGDVVSPQHVRRMLSDHPGLVVINAYGPTENTTFTTVYPMSHHSQVDDPVPIGKPVRHTQAYVLDSRGRLAPPGAVGEMYAAGAGLATGYLGDEEQTRESFGEFSPDIAVLLYRTGDIVRMDTAGRLQFLGRRDQQVKIRGFRVELGEIRATLISHPRVRDAFVTVTGDAGTGSRLLAACVPGAAELDAAELVDFLAARLPDYMVPGLWAFLPELPLTVNGKVDRRAVERAARRSTAGSSAQLVDEGADDHEAGQEDEDPERP